MSIKAFNPVERILNAEFTNRVFSDKDIDVFFTEKYGVRVRNEGMYYIFKYDQLMVKWYTVIPMYCRGHIFQFVNGKWTLVCNPPEKFYNINEKYCLPFNINYVSLKEKMDGSAITLWYAPIEKEWKISTLGTVKSLEVNGFGITFDNLFKKIVFEKVSEEDFYRVLNKGKTYMFELCSKRNIIVTKYPEETVSLLLARDNYTGEYLDDNSIRILNDILKLRKHVVHKFTNHFKNIDEIVEFVEEESKKDYQCVNPEGFVLYNLLTNEPIAKVKNQKYLILHHTISGDERYVFKNIIKAYFEGKLDDMMSDLHDDLIEGVEKVQEAIVDHSLIIEALYSEVKGIENRRDYFMKVESLLNEIPGMKKYQGFFVAAYEDRCSTLTEYLLLNGKNKSPNWMAYMDNWKEIALS